MAATSEALGVVRGRLPIDASSTMMRCARNAPFFGVARHAGRKVRPKHKGRVPEFSPALPGIPRGAKFRPPALLRFAAPSVCSGRRPLPVDHHCNTRKGAQQ